MLRNKWVVFNPTAKTTTERSNVILFNDFESAEDWTMEGNHFEKGYIIRHVPCENINGKWELDRTNYIVKEIFQKIEANAKKRNKKTA